MSSWKPNDQMHLHYHSKHHSQLATYSKKKKKPKKNHHHKENVLTIPFCPFGKEKNEQCSYTPDSLEEKEELY